MLIKMLTKQNRLHNKTLYLPGAMVSWKASRYLYPPLWWGIFQWLKTLAEESARLTFKFGSAAWIDKMTLENGLVVSSSECVHSLGPCNQAAKHPLNLNEIYSQKFETTQVPRTDHLRASCFTSLNFNFRICEMDILTPTATS